MGNVAGKYMNVILKKNTFNLIRNKQYSNYLICMAALTQIVTQKKYIQTNSEPFFEVSKKNNSISAPSLLIFINKTASLSPGTAITDFTKLTG